MHDRGGGTNPFFGTISLIFSRMSLMTMRFFLFLEKIHYGSFPFGVIFSEKKANWGGQTLSNKPNIPCFIPKFVNFRYPPDFLHHFICFNNPNS